MGKDSMILRDLFAMVITGTSVNITQTTATDYIRAVIDESGTPAIRVTGISGNSFTGGTTGSINVNGNLSVSGDLYVTGNTYEIDQYVSSEIVIGNKSTLGSWRFIQNNGDLLVQILTDVTGQTWTTKGTFLGT